MLKKKCQASNRVTNAKIKTEYIYNLAAITTLLKNIALNSQCEIFWSAPMR